MLDILDDTIDEADWHKETISNYRMIKKPLSFQDVLWNEAGPTSKKMLLKLGKIQGELQNLLNGDDRDDKVCSEPLMTRLCEDAQSSEVQDLIQHVTTVEEHMEQMFQNEIVEKLKARLGDDYEDGAGNPDVGTTKSKKVEEEKQQARKTRGASTGPQDQEDEGTESRAKDG